MAKVYTHPFPLPDDRAPEAPERLLEGLGYVLFVCRWTPVVNNWNFPRVLSPYWRLLHSRTGTAEVRGSDGSSHTLDGGNLLLIPADVETAMSAPGPIDMLWVHFLPVLPTALLLRVNFRGPLELRLRDAHRGLIHDLTDDSGGGPAGPLLFRALLDLCFGEVLAPFMGRGDGRAAPDARVLSMVAHLREHFMDAPANAELARRVGLGKDQAVRLFQKATGMTPVAYLRDIRIAEASRSLALTRASIKRIAADCGFRNRYYFTRVFSARVGMGPAAYRRRFVRMEPPGGGESPASRP